MQKLQLKTLGCGIFILLSALCILNLTGCATAPQRAGLPTYYINGVTYIPLISLCESRKIDLEYDTFSRTALLKKPPHRISLMVGETLVIIDGQPQYLRHPVDIYQGTVVVPDKFREDILDYLFKETPASAKALPSLYRLKKIVIDAGHGGNDPGTIGKTGLREKDVNLDIVKRLAAILRSEGIEVVLTRTNDRFVPLATRAEIANNSQADLFISIHSNANRVRSLNGFEVYYVTGNGNDAQRALSAAESAPLGLDSSWFASQSLTLKAILWDMIYTYDRAGSIELAREICHTIGSSLDTRILGTKGANFYVLKNVRMPAVLIEVGFLSNRREERIIKNGYYRQRIAEGIAEGINNFARDYVSTEVY